MKTLSIKEILTFTAIFLIVVSFSGCYHSNDDTKDYNYIIPESDLYVKVGYNSETYGWNVDHFNTINDAINSSEDNIIIFVFNGLYIETLVIDKEVTLIGENVFQTVIDGKQMKEDVIHITGNGTLNISGFTIKSSSIDDNFSSNGVGIGMGSDGNIIIGNIFINNSRGIYAQNADENIVKKNKFVNNYEYGAFFNSKSDNNIISDNVFTKNYYCALRIKGSKNCNIVNNIFINNEKGLYLCCGSNSNLVYGNIFCNNSHWDAYDFLDNIWDNGSIGNYWDKYHLETQGAYDNNSDGIIDTPYNIPFGNDDKYPLADIPVITNPFFKKEDLSID